MIPFASPASRAVNSSTFPFDSIFRNALFVSCSLLCENREASRKGWRRGFEAVETPSRASRALPSNRQGSLSFRVGCSFKMQIFVKT